MIHSYRLPFRTYIKEVIILKETNNDTLQKEINIICKKYSDIDKSKFVSNIQYLMVVIGTTIYYSAIITISKEKCYNDDSNED